MRNFTLVPQLPPPSYEVFLGERRVFTVTYRRDDAVINYAPYIPNSWNESRTLFAKRIEIYPSLRAVVVVVSENLDLTRKSPITLVYLVDDLGSPILVERMGWSVIRMVSKADRVTLHLYKAPKIGWGDEKEEGTSRITASTETYGFNSRHKMEDGKLSLPPHFYLREQKKVVMKHMLDVPPGIRDIICIYMKQGRS